MNRSGDKQFADNLGATSEEVKASLREDVALALKTCNQQRTRIAELERELAAKSNLYEFLDPEFLILMDEIGRYGHEKQPVDGLLFGNRARLIPRHRKEQILNHARQHITDYENGIPHDHFGDASHQLAAAAFNLLMEFYFSQGE